MSAHVFIDPRIADLPAARAAIQTLAVIDELLEVPARPPVRFQVTGSKLIQGEYVYAHGAPDQPLAMRVSRFAVCPHLTIAHEIGHYLDNQWLHRLKRDFASPYEPDFDDLRLTWTKSRFVQAVQTAVSRHRSRMSASNVRFLRSLLQIHELWARSFAQWVVAKTANDQLQSELAQRQIELGWLVESRYTPYWQDDDFVPIAVALESLLRKKRLLC